MPFFDTIATGFWSAFTCSMVGKDRTTANPRSCSAWAISRWTRIGADGSQRALCCRPGVACRDERVAHNLLNSRRCSGFGRSQSVSKLAVRSNRTAIDSVYEENTLS